MAKSKLTFEQRHTFTVKNPVISWSMYSTFISPYGDGKDRWYQTYVKGMKQHSAELTFGKAVADSMETANPMVSFTRYGVKKDGTMEEHEFDTKLGKIPLVGSMDTYEPPNKRYTFALCGEFKTGVAPWDQKRVDDHGQLTFYTLCLLLQDDIKPDKVHWFLEWARTIKTESGDFNHKIELAQPIEIKHFTTHRTIAQVLELAAQIKKVHAEMLDYVKNHD